MPLALPLLVSFAEVAGITIGAVATAAGIDLLSEKVESYMEENPEQSQKILAMIMPGQGLAQVFQKKAKKPSKKKEIEVEVEEVDVEDVDARDLTKKEKAKKMKELAKSGGGNMREKMIKGYEEAGKKIVEIGRQEVNQYKIYIKFDCILVDPIIPPPKPKVPPKSELTT